MTMEMIALLVLMAVTASVSVCFALKMTWDNLHEGSEKTVSRAKKEKIVRFGCGTVVSGSN